MAYRGPCARCTEERCPQSKRYCLRHLVEERLRKRRAGRYKMYGGKRGRRPVAAGGL